MSTRHKHPDGALCAAGGFYPPLRVAAAEPPTGRLIVDPYRWRVPFIEPHNCVRFGRLRASPTELRSFRFSLCTLPGGFGNQRVGTIPVRHYPAALPPAPTDGFYHATNRAVLSAAGICSRLYSLKMFCRLSTPVRIIDSPS